MSLPVFISCSEAKQITELKRFLKSRGAKSLDATECRQETWVEEFRKCISSLNICWREDTISESETEDVLTTVASLVIQLPVDRLDEIVTLLCKEYLDFTGEKPRKHWSKLTSLNLLFNGLAPDSHCRHAIFVALVKCALNFGAMQQIVTDPSKVSQWLSTCKCTVSERQYLWRFLYDAHTSLGDTKRATETLVNLLSTYTDASAVEARQDAIKCIISVIQDPCLYSHDQLYLLRPVQFLEGEPIHDFFKIFVSGDLKTFQSFIEKHPEFLKQNGLSEENCLNKLRLLTLMQIAEDVSELDYAAAAKELDLEIDRLEPFVIEAVRQRAVACKLDQIQQRILITSATPRTFGRAQWISLRDTLLHWRSGLQTVQHTLNNMVDVETK